MSSSRSNKSTKSSKSSIDRNSGNSNDENTINSRPRSTISSRIDEDPNNKTDSDSNIHNNTTESATNPEISTIEINEKCESSESDTLGFTPMILKTMQSSMPIMDREDNLVNEFGFEESIIIPNDFRSEDIHLEVIPNGFCVRSAKECSINENSKTQTFHQMKYLRVFDRPVRNIDMQIIQGRVIIFGDFDDFDYPQ